MAQTTEAESNLAAQTAAQVVQDKILKMAELGDYMATLTKTMAAIKRDHLGRTIERRHISIRFIKATGDGSTGVILHLDNRPGFSQEEKLRILDQIADLALEYARREAAAVYDQIQEAGKDL